MVICINSLYRLKFDDEYLSFTDIILDEVVGIFDMLMGSLITPRHRKTIIRMLTLLVDPQRNKRRTCIIADALVGDRELDFLSSAAHLTSQNTKIWRFFPPLLTQRLPEIVYCVSKNQWCSKLVTDLNQEGKRIVLPTSLKDHTYELLQLIQNGDPDLITDLSLDLNSCLLMVGKEWFKVDGNTDPVVVNRLIMNHAQVLNANDRFLYTPVIQSGVDFNQNNPYHVGFGLAGTFFSANTFVQMLRRNRNFCSDVPGERAKMYVHVVGEETEWSEDCSVETLMEMIKEYTHISSDKRKQLASLVNIETASGGVNRITSYFTQELDQDVVRLMAYTLQAAILFKKDKLGYLKRIVKMNDPNWPFTVDVTESSKKPVTAKHCRELLKNSASQWITQEICCKGDIIQCKDPDEVIALFKRFNCLGDKPITDLEVSREAVLFPMQNTMELMVHRGRFSISPFALVLQSIFIGTSRTTEAYTVYKDNHNIGCMVRELFESFSGPWKDHVTELNKPNRQRFIAVAIDLDKLDTLVIDVNQVLRYWKPLARWNNRFSTILLGNDIDCIPDLDPEAQPNARQVSSMKNIMAAVFGLLGIECRLTDKYMIRTRTGNGKRKRCVIRSIVDALRSANDRSTTPESLEEMVTVDTRKPVTVTMSEHAVNKERFLRQYDLCMRRDIMELILVPPGRYDRFLNFDGATPGTMGNSQQVTDYNKPMLQKFIKLLKAIDSQVAKQFMSTASFWILKEPGYSVNLGILNAFSVEVKNKVLEVYRTFNIANAQIEPAFALSEDTPLRGGGDTSEEDMASSHD